ncbi:MAG: discoidin domain-containing protein [Gammaproteobacteria bacterium]|nr:discoidin domain-containing protein [Gammaproteobacteria bacterium]
MSDGFQRFARIEPLVAIDGWQAIAPGQTRLVLAAVPAPSGSGLGLRFDFGGGGGFVVARHTCALDLPEEFSFRFLLRGEAPSNIFELKLVDASGQNVWRFRREACRFTADWREIVVPARDLPFAWGPLGGGPPRDIAAVEIVIAAGDGGSGEVDIADIGWRDDTYRLTPRASASSALPGHTPDAVAGATAPPGWRSVSAGEEWIALDFGCAREFGALVIDWEAERVARAFAVDIALEDSAWCTAYTAGEAGAVRSVVMLPDCRARHVRVRCLAAASAQGYGIWRLDVRPHAWGASRNAFFAALAREAPTGDYPKYLLGAQSFWTTVGAPDGGAPALVNEQGLVELGRGGPTLEAFVAHGGRLHGWADFESTPSLEAGWIPVPTLHARCGGFDLELTAFATHAPPRGALYVAYRLINRRESPEDFTLYATLRPFQVTPTWQAWQRYGGAVEISELEFRDDALVVDGRLRIVPLTAPAGCGAAAFAQGSIVDFLARGELPESRHVRDPFSAASAAFAFPARLAPGAQLEVHFAIPFGDAEAPETVASARAALRRRWDESLGTWNIELPAPARDLALELRTAAAHILVNRAGPALQPGPRRYTRAWIRDGAMMGAALARLGLAAPLRDFVRWYARAQAADGLLPDCLDEEGAEWLPEFDCFGQFVFAVAEYYRFTADRAFLREMWPALHRALRCFEGLRSRRLTAEYENGDKSLYRGLLPESMSHEGYMAHPVHAYWDDFWGLRGLKDAVMIAEALGESAAAADYAAQTAALRRDLLRSIAACQQRHGIDFLPGAAELGDFDPAATAIAWSPVDEGDALPRAAADRTFDRYLALFESRLSGDTWTNYSAYEVRIIGALLRLGRRREALAVLAFMREGQRPAAWHQWPEITWRDPRGPSFLGDLPHGWISAEFIFAALAAFAYEREADRSLVIAAGVDPAWLRGDGIAVDALPTHYGPLSYSIRPEGRGLRVRIAPLRHLPRGGVVLALPAASLDVPDPAPLTIRTLPADMLVDN